MLSWFRKHAKSRAAKALYVILAITFFGGFGILSVDWWRGRQGNQTTEPIAVVAGEELSAREFIRNYERAKRNWYQQMSRFYGEVPEELLDTNTLKQDVLDEMVNRVLLQQEAKKLGIKISASEVNTQISQIPYFHDQSGAFSPQVYKRVLNSLQITEDEFESEVKQQLLINRVTSLIVAPVSVSEDEVKAYYEKSYEEVNLEFFEMDSEARYAQLKPEEKEIEQYYQSHISEFDWPEVRKISYFRFPVSDFEKAVQVTEADINDYYEKSKDRYISKPEQGHFRHILVKTPENASQDELNKARDKAEKIAGQILAGEDFAELAKKYSDDPGSAVKGGDLGWSERGSLVPEFENTGYSLPIGGVSEPVKSRYGFHIIQLLELKPAEYKPLSDVKDEIKKELIRLKARDMAREKADQVLKDCLAKGMKDAAKKHGIQLKESEYFKKGESGLDGIPDSKDITLEAFFMEQGQVSEVFSGLDDLYIFEVIEIKEPHQATLEEAKPKIIRKLTPELKLARTKEDARKDLDELRKGVALSVLANKEKAEVQETDWFQRGSQSIPKLGSGEELTKLVFNLTEKEPVPEDVYASGVKVYVFKLKGVKPADMAKFQEERNKVQDTLLRKKQQETFDRYLENLKKGKVEIKEDVYKQIE